MIDFKGKMMENPVMVGGSEGWLKESSSISPSPGFFLENHFLERYIMNMTLDSLIFEQTNMKILGTVNMFLIAVLRNNGYQRKELQVSNSDYTSYSPGWKWGNVPTQTDGLKMSQGWWRDISEAFLFFVCIRSRDPLKQNHRILLGCLRKLVKGW